MRVLGDSDVRRVSAGEAVQAMREALRAHAEGEFLSPPRVSTTLGDTRVMFGAGGAREGGIALRVSGTAASPLEYVTITWLPTGEVDAIIVGQAIGARRTGAVAADAIDTLAQQGALRVGILGSGRNGRAQVWGLSGAREITELAVYSPTANHREAFADRARAELGLDARAVDSPRAAAEAMDVVVLCTISRSPVIDADWVRDCAVVSSIGAKSISAHEAPAELLERMSRVVSDAPDEIAAPLSDLAGLPLIPLGSLRSGHGPQVVRGAVSLFLYAGLGGADAAYAQAVARLA